MLFVPFQKNQKNQKPATLRPPTTDRYPDDNLLLTSKCHFPSTQWRKQFHRLKSKLSNTDSYSFLLVRCPTRSNSSTSVLTTNTHKDTHPTPIPLLLLKKSTSFGTNFPKNQCPTYKKKTWQPPFREKERNPPPEK